MTSADKFLIFEDMELIMASALTGYRDLVAERLQRLGVKDANLIDDQIRNRSLLRRRR